MSILNFGFDFPIVRSKIKIDVNLSVTYQTYQENNRNPTEKELGQYELPVKR